LQKLAIWNVRESSQQFKLAIKINSKNEADTEYNKQDPKVGFKDNPNPLAGRIRR
jgi:hypothetical protein